MKSIAICTVLLSAVIPATSLSAAPAPEDVKTVLITANDTLKFSVTRIEVQAGQRIHIQLKNTGSMPKEVMGHNWILLKAGTDISTYATTALSAKNESYQPRALAGEVLASIPLLGPRQTGEVTFEAPATPGSYPYLCSFPGHFQAGMQGLLIVK
jgi:azurin